MREPLVSIIIPTFNRRTSLPAAVESALAQTYRRCEIVVIDDGSTDGTAELLKQFGHQIRVVRQANSGAAAARNRGVECSTGDIIAFLDSDDVWAPAKVERQVRLLERVGPEIPCCLCNVQFTQWQNGCGSSFSLADMRPRLTEGIWTNPAEVLITRFVLFNQALAVRREALLRTGLFRTKLRVLEDYDLAIRLSFLGSWAFIAEPQVRYGVPRGNSLSRWGEAEPGRIPGLMCDILQDILTTPEAAVPFIRRRLRWEEICWRIFLRSARLRQAPLARNRLAGFGLLFLGRARNALFRRSPWWPRMQVQRVEEYLRRSEPGAATHPPGFQILGKTAAERA